VGEAALREVLRAEVVAEAAAAPGGASKSLKDPAQGADTEEEAGAAGS
jgi:hypothetical protein